MNSNTQNASNVNTGNEDYLDKGTFPFLSSLALQITPTRSPSNKAGHLN
jgi:hypothetical protein